MSVRGESVLTGAAVDDLAMRVGRSMRRFRGKQSLSVLSEPAGVFFTVTHWQGLPYALPMVWLATSGCRHVTAYGGCTMCDFGRGEFENFSLLAGLETVLARLGAPPLLHLALPGSFMDECEVVPALRRSILESVARHGVLSLGAEARPEFITGDAIENVVRVLRGTRGTRCVEFTLGTGVEAFDDSITRICLNKGSTRVAARRALDAIQAVDRSQHGFDVRAEGHVLLRPPVLTEAEAIEDALLAIEWCLTEGFERVILMLCSTRPRSPLALLAGESSSAGSGYRPASLWSAVEVLVRLPDTLRAKVRVHGFASNTDVGIRPTTCPACEQAVTAAIQHFNATGADDGLRAVQNLGCPCRDSWLAECAEPEPAPIAVRLTAFVGELERVSSSDEATA
jgi:radical SAM enzyme (TIGR01210 family)